MTSRRATVPSEYNLLCAEAILFHSQSFNGGDEDGQGGEGELARPQARGDAAASAASS